MEKCRLCHQSQLEEFIDLSMMPIAHRLLTSANELEQTYPLKLHLCKHCYLVQIIHSINPAILYSSYNYNFSSWKLEPHFGDEVALIIEQKISSVFEIGCNDGRFLHALRENGVTSCVALEPNLISGQIARERGFPIYEEMIGVNIAKIAVNKYGPFELVVSRQVLEHVQNIDCFFDSINILLKEDGVLFIDVPDFEPGLIQGDCSVIWEEHVSYFTEQILVNLLVNYGFSPISIQKYNFSGGTIAVLAKRNHDLENKKLSWKIENTTIIQHLNSYQDKVKKYQQQLSKILCRLHQEGVIIVLYGVGARACTMINGLRLGAYINFSVDDQNERQNKYMPGTRLPIYSSDVLIKQKGTTICLLAVNNENEEKVKQHIKSKMNNILFISLFAPRNIWTELKSLQEYTTSIAEHK